MHKGYSLHIGVNNADPQHYHGLSPLKAAVNDAIFWESYARKEGYLTAKLFDSKATSFAVKSILADYAAKMTPGDILLLTYAGHGGTIANLKQAGLDNEPYDQTWCLYDRQLLDDEIYECFRDFAKGTRILVVSDSCHSGTITRKETGINLSSLLLESTKSRAASRGMSARILPTHVAQIIQEDFNDAVYRPLLEAFQFQRKAEGVEASVMLLAACQDHQVTYDGAENGIFTEALKQLLRKHKNLSGEALIQSISRFYTFPTPNFFRYGGIIRAFDTENPFKIIIPDADVVIGNRDPLLPEAKGNPGFVLPPDGWSPESPAKTKAAVLRVEIHGASGVEELDPGNDVKLLRYENHGAQHIWEIEMPKVPMEQAWSIAHTLEASLRVKFPSAKIEPLLSVNLLPSPMTTSREADRKNPDYIQEWPPAATNPKVPIGWHLDEEHTQLNKAREAVMNNPDAQPEVRIAHLDTGYMKKHDALPKNIKFELAANFVAGEDPNQAFDKMDNEGQDGHGTGTGSLLAGRKLNRDQTFGEFEGFVGGAPEAEIIPMRISDSVVIWNSDNFCKAIQRAIDLGCEVVSMSLAGKPSHKMAEMVDMAYEAGIVMVTSASNCWYKGAGAILPKCVLFPAAFPRVIGATGALYTHEPYDQKFMLPGRFNITTQYMQGSWGPPSRMGKALAAYTPNLPWASDPYPIVRSGGGTSSATPQIAAAAALYIAYHKKELKAKGYYEPGKQWMKVEAVRNALYKSAAKDEVFKEWKKYYGNGILRAYDALHISPAEPEQLTKAEESKVALGGLWNAAKSMFLNRFGARSEEESPSDESLAMELIHLVQTDPAFWKDFQKLDLSNAKSAKKLLQSATFRKKLAASTIASSWLKERLG